MAIFDGKFIKGTAGPSVYKKYRGQQVIQGKSALKTTKRTAGTKKAASVFGTASKLACSFRDTMNQIISSFYDGTMIFRLNTEVLFSIRHAQNLETGTYEFSENSFERLNGFNFNNMSPLKNSFFVQPEVNITGNTLQVTLPEFKVPHDLKFFKDARICRLNICTTMYDLTYGHKSPAAIKSTDIVYNLADPVTIEPKQWDFEIEPGCLCIVAISLQYIEKGYSGNVIINSKIFNPSAIVKAIIAAGVVNKAVTKEWVKIDFKSHKN